MSIVSRSKTLSHSAVRKLISAFLSHAALTNEAVAKLFAKLRVHAEEQRRLCWHRLDVLQVAFVGRWLRGHPRQLALGIGDHVNLIKQLIAHEVKQVLLGHPTIPVVHDVPAVHDLSEDVPQVVPWDLNSGRALQVVVQHLR